MNDNEKTPIQKKTRKKLLFILLGAGAGILLLLIGSGWFSSALKTTAAVPLSAEEELSLYRAALEERVETLCSSVAGVGGVRVAVSLSGGFETLYATEIKNGSEVYATVGSGSNAEAIVISRNPPEIVGIGVVCRGGGNAAVRAELTALLSSAFHVPTNRIYITEAKK